jgi:cell division protein FtsB
MIEPSQPPAQVPITGPGTKRLPIGRWILILSILFTVYAWTFGPYGVIRQQRTAERLASMQVRNDSLRSHVRILEDSLRLLSLDSATIASEARRLGFVLPGEIAVRFVDTSGLRPRRK